VIAIGSAGKGFAGDHRISWWFGDEMAIGAFSTFLGDRGTSGRPGLAWLDDTLYMAWRGPRDDQDLFWATLQMQHGQVGSWSAQQGPLDQRGSLYGPALIAYHGALYMCWRGVNDDHDLFWARFDKAAQQWGPQQRMGDQFASLFSPALAVFQDKMYLTFRGAQDDQRLFWTTFDEPSSSWEPRHDLGDRGSALGPTLVAFRDNLFMFWRGVNDDTRIWFSTFDGRPDSSWTPQQLVEPELNSIDGPAAAVLRGNIYLAHSPFFLTFGGEEGTDLQGYVINITKFDGAQAVLPSIPASNGTGISMFTFPEITNSVRTFLLRQGMDPGQGVSQAGRGGLRHLMGLA
jgi:hypothetical protein